MMGLGSVGVGSVRVASVRLGSWALVVGLLGSVSVAAAAPATIGFRSGQRLYVDDRNAYEKLVRATGRVDPRSRSKGFVELEFQNGNPVTVNLDEVEYFCRSRCESETAPAE